MILPNLHGHSAEAHDQRGFDMRAIDQFRATFATLTERIATAWRLARIKGGGQHDSTLEAEAPTSQMDSSRGPRNSKGGANLFTYLQ